MTRTIRLAALAAVLLASATAASAGVGAEAAQKLYDRVTPSLVAVKYTWESELGRRELTGAGVVVSEDGLILSTLAVFDTRIPDEQMKEFKVIIPSQERDPEELEAEFQGRDERTSLAFIKVKDASAGKASDKKEDKAAKDDAGEKGAEEKGKVDGDKPDAKKEAKASSASKPKHVWKPLKFEDVPVKIGEPILSVGLLPEAAAYKTYFMEAAVSVTLRGETPQVLVQGGGLAAVGSPVFNAEGKAVGIVGSQQGQQPFLNDGPQAMAAINNPPKFFTPTSDITQSLKDPPVAGKPLRLPWMGVPQLTGLNKDVAEVFNLTDKPAVQVGEVIPETPAAKAGLKQGDIIVQVNGKPLERGDEPEELPSILRRQLLRMNVGDDVTLSVMRKKNQPLQDIKVTLAEQPPRPNTAKRFFADDLGFAVRDLTFFDTYARRLPGDTKGVTVALMRPQSAAQSGGLQNGDMIIQLNGQPAVDVGQFQKAYKDARKERPREAVVLVVRREGREDTVRIEPPQ